MFSKVAAHPLSIVGLQDGRLNFRTSALSNAYNASYSYLLSTRGSIYLHFAILIKNPSCSYYPGTTSMVKSSVTALIIWIFVHQLQMVEPHFMTDRQSSKALYQPLKDDSIDLFERDPRPINSTHWGIYHPSINRSNPFLQKPVVSCYMSVCTMVAFADFTMWAVSKFDPTCTARASDRYFSLRVWSGGSGSLQLLCRLVSYSLGHGNIFHFLGKQMETNQIA